MNAGTFRLETAWGPLGLVLTPRGVKGLWWPGEDPWPLAVEPCLAALAGFLEGRVPFPEALPVDLDDQPPFRRAVFEALRRTAPGRTLTYGDLAVRAGFPRAARAVGQALKRNPLPILVPCHRVLGAGWDGGYSFPGGLEAKARLLELERS